MRVYLQRQLNEDWAVWTGPDDSEGVDSPGTDDLVWFHPGDRGGYRLDAYSFARARSDDLGFDLREIPQPR